MQHAEKRHRVWYAKLAVPADVQHIIGKAKFFKSTQTESASKAAPRVALLVSQWQAEIDRARAALPNPKDDFWQTLRQQYTTTLDEGTRRAIEEIAGAESKRLRDDGTVYRLAIGVDPLPTPLGPLVASWKDSLRVSQKTIDQRHRDVRKMADHFVSLEALQPHAVKAWTDKLMQDGAVQTTMARMGEGCRSFWSYLRMSGTVPMIAPDPFDGSFKLAGKVAKKTTQGRKAFTPEELAAIYAHAVKDDEPLADLIALGAYTGARIESLCALTLETSKDGVLMFDDKTDAGERQVPVHPKLRTLVKRLRKDSTDGHLIPSTAAGKYGVRSDPLSKRFGRLKTSLGFGPGHVFHSIRKTVSTLMEQAGVPEGVAADILGHDKKTMTYGLYSAGSSMKQKADALAMVKYPLPLDRP